MNIESKFNHLGVDAVTGVQLMNLLKLEPNDFLDEARFERFKDVIQFFKNMPDVNYIINKITVGKFVDKLDHVWGYTELSKQRASLKDQAKEIMREMDTYQDVGDEFQKVMVIGLQERLNGLNGEVRKVDEQISKYE